MGGPPNLVPDMFELQLSFSITNYLHKLKKQAKMESERVVSAISQNRTNDAHKRSNGMSVKKGLNDTYVVEWEILLRVPKARFTICRVAPCCEDVGMYSILATQQHSTA